MHLGVLTVGDILELIVAVGAIAVETEIRRGPLQDQSWLRKDMIDAMERASAGSPATGAPEPPPRSPRGARNFHGITLQPLP